MRSLRGIPHGWNKLRAIELVRLLSLKLASHPTFARNARVGLTVARRAARVPFSLGGRHNGQGALCAFLSWGPT
eukprot:365192-Chlamydomonas_euryale.AAC.32